MAVHAVQNLFESPDCEAVLLVDATNVFNSLNHQNALRNILRICPALATTAINSCREDVPLFVNGDVILSSAETIQRGSPCYGNICDWNPPSHSSP